MFDRQTVDDVLRFLQMDNQEVRSFDEEEFEAWIKEGRPHVVLPDGAWDKVRSKEELEAIKNRYIEQRKIFEETLKKGNYSSGT